MSATGAETHCLSQTGAQASRAWSSELRGRPGGGGASRSPSSCYSGVSHTLTGVPNTCRRPGAGGAAATGRGPSTCTCPRRTRGPGAVCGADDPRPPGWGPGRPEAQQPLPGGLGSSDGCGCPCGGSGPAGGRQPWAPRPRFPHRLRPETGLLRTIRPPGLGLLKG